MASLVTSSKDLMRVTTLGSGTIVCFIWKGRQYSLYCLFLGVGSSQNFDVDCLVTN